MKKRLISLLLAFSMMLTFLPAGAVSAFAEENIDSSKGTLIPNDYTGSVYTIAEENVTYQMKGNYNFPIEITATGVTINITGDITYGFDSYHDASWGFSYLINVKPTGGVTINNDNCKVTTDKSDCGFVATWGTRTAQNPNAPAGSAIINGGNYTTYNQEPLWNSQGEMTLNKVTAECQNDLAVTNRMGTMIIDGGSYKSINSTAIYNNRGGEMTIKGNPEVVAQNGVALCSASGVVKVEGGSFSGGNGSYSDSNWTSAESAVCNWKNSKMTITGGTFTGTDRADAIVNNGEMHIANATVDAKNGSALKNQDLGSGTHSASTEIISGTFKNSAKGIDLQSGSVVLKDAEFSGNGADIYLNTGKQITIEKTFNHNATVACADPTDGRQLTTATTGKYQKNLNLTSADAGYLVGYKTADGKEYRCLSKLVGVTINGLKSEIKAEDTAEFTVTLDHAGSTGTGILTFGDKNSEIEYKDENDKYVPMPNDGLPIDKNDYAFRITPKKAGEQKLTAAVERDAVKLGTAEENFTVADRDHTTVTIEGLEDAVIKEGESKDFTVKVDPKDDAKLGEAFIDFGDKNSEIEYQDKNGAYQPMPEGGLPIDLGDVKEQYAFRITPKETSKQTLTAAVKQDKNELARDEEDFVVSEMPILTLKDGVITSVTVPGKNGADPEDITEIVKKNANEDGSFNVPEGATVSVAFDKDAFADSGLKFGHWDITGLDDPNAYQDKESFAFVMPAKAVTLKAMTQDASIEDDEPDIVGPIVIGTTVVVGGAVLGYQAYSLGAEFAGKLLNLPYFPSNRSALAMMLWEDAGKPMPESELLYPDVGQEERDMDLQHAARWAMENELIPDLNDEGTAPEEMKFYPDNAVSKIDVLKAWQKAQELKQNA